MYVTFNVKKQYLNEIISLFGLNEDDAHERPDGKYLFCISEDKMENFGAVLRRITAHGLSKYHIEWEHVSEEVVQKYNLYVPIAYKNACSPLTSSRCTANSFYDYRSKVRIYLDDNIIRYEIPLSMYMNIYLIYKDLMEDPNIHFYQAEEGILGFLKSQPNTDRVNVFMDVDGLSMDAVSRLQPDNNYINLPIDFDFKKWCLLFAAISREQHTSFFKNCKTLTKYFVIESMSTACKNHMNSNYELLALLNNELGSMDASSRQRAESPFEKDGLRELLMILGENQVKFHIPINPDYNCDVHKKIDAFIASLPSELCRPPLTVAMDTSLAILRSTCQINVYVPSYKSDTFLPNVVYWPKAIWHGGSEKIVRLAVKVDNRNIIRTCLGTSCIPYAFSRDIQGNVQEVFLLERDLEKAQLKSVYDQQSSAGQTEPKLTLQQIDQKQ